MRLSRPPPSTRTRVFVPEDVDQPEFPGDSRPILLGVSEDGFVQRASNAAQFISADILFDTPTLSLDSFFRS
jgi:hypothetical protein